MTRPVLAFLVTQQPDMETDPDGNPALTVKRADGEDITLKRGQLGEPLKNFLDYLNGKEITGDAFIDDLDRAVKEARKNTELRQEYMTNCATPTPKSSVSACLLTRRQNILILESSHSKEDCFYAALYYTPPCLG